MVSAVPGLPLKRSGPAALAIKSLIFGSISSAASAGFRSSPTNTTRSPPTGVPKGWKSIFTLAAIVPFPSRSRRRREGRGRLGGDSRGVAFGAHIARLSRRWGGSAAKAPKSQDEWDFVCLSPRRPGDSEETGARAWFMDLIERYIFRIAFGA